MKVHSSNYQICGFTSSVSEEELTELGREMNVPVVTDLGSGALVDLSQYGLPKEPTVQEKVAQGVDLVSFSGDKLLGGVQAGIIVGKKNGSNNYKHILSSVYYVAIKLFYQA